MRTPDKYDTAIAFLKNHPDEILRAWAGVTTHPAGALFDFAGPGDTCGCLTQVKANVYPAANPRLTQAIRADQRLPCRREFITLEILPVFAEWQRKLDRYAFRRKAVAR